MQLHAASPADIPALRAIEAKPDYADLVGAWSAERHAAHMQTPGVRYLAWRDGDRLAGFAILEDVEDEADSFYLRRIAVDEAGRGVGAAFLRALVDWVFQATPTHRLSLRVLENNERARRAYLSCGFVEEGLLRDSVLDPRGERRAMRVMSILRPEWEARR